MPPIPEHVRISLDIPLNTFFQVQAVPISGSACILVQVTSKDRTFETICMYGTEILVPLIATIPMPIAIAAPPESFDADYDDWSDWDDDDPS